MVKVLKYMCVVNLCTCSGFWTSPIGSDIGTHVYHDKASGSGNIAVLFLNCKVYIGSFGTL